MDFPIKKEDLINYRDNFIIKENTDARIKKIVSEICSGVENTVKTTSIHYYIYNADRDLIFDFVRKTVHLPSQQLVIKKVLEELSIKFPDSAIILDPLLKTIKVDWSNQGPYDWHG